MYVLRKDLKTVDLPHYKVLTINDLLKFANLNNCSKYLPELGKNAHSHDRTFIGNFSSWIYFKISPTDPQLCQVLSVQRLRGRMPG
jgi:hypothetical protein